MLYLLRNAECFAPTYLGSQDLLIGGSRILQISPSISLATNTPIQELDMRGKWIIPGLVDSLVHITGGGGEDGFASRTPELKLSDAYEAGITTMIGALGTDSLTRTHSNLLAKARELQHGGIHCLCHTGSYHLPVRTLTGSIEQDIVYIPEFIGVGEIAISDHRSSQPDMAAICDVAAQARVAGMISGKAGIVSIHTGDGSSGLKPLLDVANTSDIPLSQFYPTHINRNPTLFNSSMDYLRSGGFIDLTTSTTPEILASGEVKCSQALAALLAEKAPIEQITFSSDGNASLPLFDENNTLKGLQVGRVSSLWDEVRDAIQQENIAPEIALKVATLNPAEVLKLSSKGRLRANGDADLLIIDPDSLAIESVMSQGTWRILDQKILHKGPFE